MLALATIAVANWQPLEGQMTQTTAGELWDLIFGKNINESGSERDK